MRLIRWILAVVAMGGAALAQTSSATVQVQVGAPPPFAAIAVTQSATTVAAGGRVNFIVTASAPTGAATPTGSVELLATLPGATAKTLINTFPLTNGSFTCSYPVPATAPVGGYQIEFVYGGAGANYKPSPDFQ